MLETAVSIMGFVSCFSSLDAGNMKTLSGTIATDQPFSEEMGRFFRGLRQLVLDEATTVRQNIHALWSKPITARVSEGRAIEDVRVADVWPDGYIELAYDRNSSRARQGDILCLNRSNPFAEPSDMVTLVVDNETVLVVSSQ